MRRLRGEDAALWHRAMRHVAPLPGRAPPPEPAPSSDRRHPAGLSSDAGETPAVPGRRPSVPVPPLDAFAGVDRATAERLKRGQRAIEARLDLHGMTQAEAHRALAAFVSGSRAAGRRCVLVITGHGRMSGGVLKHAVPRWLNEPDLRRHVLAIAPARPQHGGHGALYLLLRKDR
ncbi:MAG: Smr/MutS family protein [Alphaproteobacteria bacterium]|nr:Smr/MutS family protein [Alphaproteobacteria bacterium]MBV9017245.1 Smr/MutS family protein [Alphaproteobacteria bacterium]MBV9150962.1 Smr/MutS family protein [Alphaproteobacteria bacterium]MBV9584206.1 Smr/MutS family protein [Alphaproteobacteria bacterium]